jgi:hypothetical protein
VVAAADVGIAMGTGTDVAMESAGVTLLKGDLQGIVRARRLSEATMRDIRQNLFVAFVYIALGVPMAAEALYPAFGLLLSPIFEEAAMALSSVGVIGNAFRMRGLRLKGSSVSASVHGRGGRPHDRGAGKGRPGHPQGRPTQRRGVVPALGVERRRLDLQVT